MFAPPLRFLDPNHVRKAGRSLTYFGGCDYLRLGGHPEIRQALIAGLQKGPFNSGASRATTGEDPRYIRAEKALSRFFKQPDAILVGAGYLAPIAAAQAMASTISHVVLDTKAHASLADAARLSGKPTYRFESGDLAQLARSLKRKPSPLLLTEGLIGASGRIVPLDDYLQLLPPQGLMLVDDAHGAGVLGRGGRGTTSHFGLADSRIITTLSLSKALGLQGGAVLGAIPIIDSLRQRASAFTGNTAPLFAIAAGLRVALEVLNQSSERIERLRRFSQTIHALVKDLPAVVHDEDSPVLSVALPRPERSATLSKTLLQRSIFPSFIRYGANEDGYFRFALSAGHKDSEIANLGAALCAGLTSG